jgi:hypothetical protein
MDAWYWPFVLILCSPIVTVPLMHVILNLSAHFSAAELEQEPSIGRWGRTFFYLRDVRLAHMPGSMNLLAVAWLTCPSAQTKLAAVLAGLLGAVRLAVPLLVLEGASVTYQGDTYVLGSRMFFWSGPCSIGLWLLTAATLGLFGASSAIVAWLAERRARRNPLPPGSS